MSDAPVSSAPNRRPMVGKAVSDRGPWLFAAAAIVGGAILFGALESRRTTITAPAIAQEPDSAGSVIAPPPELALPPVWQVQPQIQQAPAQVVPVAPQRITAAPNFETPRRYSQEVETPPPPVAINTPSLPTAVVHESPEVVFRAQGAGTTNPAPPKPDASGKSERVEASRFANPATTVPKGTVIQSVLESALDSTRGGMARAIISRDIYGFDGTKVLIPRGSRLIGEYKADVQQGQSRALIEWQRLMRPDGVLINLDSPSADPLGRAGIKGKVNSHFLARYSGAILQSALQIGEQVAVNSLAPATTIYALPLVSGTQGASQGLGQQAGSSATNIQPTVTVKQGTSVSVFVVRDLDFTSVEP